MKVVWINPELQKNVSTRNNVSKIDTLHTPIALEKDRVTLSRFDYNLLIGWEKIALQMLVPYEEKYGKDKELRVKLGVL